MIGLIPAAGIGSRLPDRQGSKEMVLVGQTPRPAITYLLDAYRRAGIEQTRIVLRPEKVDIVDYVGDTLGEQCQTIFTPGTTGVPETLALALDAPGSEVALGFPDILFAPADAFATLIHKLRTSDADVVLGLFPTDTPEKMDMVSMDAQGRVTEIQIKPRQTTLALTWILAVWRPTFSSHLIEASQAAIAEGEPLEHLGHALLSAMAAGLVVSGVPFAQGRSLDIGTPDDLARAQHWSG